jgi:glyoxylate/hydroxypyruvate reductase
MLNVNIVICFPPSPNNKDALRWQSDLQAALPAASIELWQDGSAFQADYAIVWRAPQAFFDTQKNLKAIFNAGAGVDALQSLTLPVGVPLVRLEDAGMGLQMAQYVVYAVLTYFRQFDVYAEQAAAGQWAPKAPRRYEDYPIGLLGYGTLGKAIAQALTSLGFKVHAWARSEHAGADIPVFAGDAALSDFLTKTRILVCVLPLTPKTQGIVNAGLLSQLQPKAYFINAARGGHVVEADLLAALNDGTLVGVTTDVCIDEPAKPDHPFWHHPKLTLTPHIAATTLREDSVAQIAQKIQLLERGQPISGVIQNARGY